MLPILLHLLPASIYLGLAAAWRLAGDEAHPMQRNLARAGLLLAVVLHGFTLAGDLDGSRGLHFGFSIALSMTLWLAMAFYWLESFFTPIQGLQALAMPVAAISTLLPLLFPEQHELPDTGSAVFRIHFIVAMLAYSLLTLAALHAVMMVAAERQLHSARLTRALAALPPLLVLENLLFRLVGGGFVLLTLTVGSGILFSEALFGKPLSFSHKTIFALAAWAVFGTLLFGRMVWGWRGKRALHLTLAGFIFLLLAYIGTRFVLEVILGKPG
ncbi:MAG: cytochrome c biogenesis protein CcsA [Betaproteobacteria bacterium]|nr:cytochrome c biogenesis protein CcsA [Betaproteobacteria bacterium]